MTENPSPERPISLNVIKQERQHVQEIIAHRLLPFVTPDLPRDSEGRVTILSVGSDEFPLAIPIVERNGKWIFDTKAGRNEILMRRIGANELDAIEICRGFVEAQHDYAHEKHASAT